MSKPRDKVKHKDKYIKLGLNIRKYRMAQNYSQETLAFEINSTRNYIGCIERAEKAPSLAFLFDIASVLKIDFKDLFEDID